MAYRTFDDMESQKDCRIDLPMSNSTTTEAASMRDVSIASSDSAADESDWPRTWRAYFCWFGCFILMFNSWGLVNAYGTFSSYYAGHSLRSVDQLELNLIGSTQCFLVLLLSAVTGRLLDAGNYRYVIGTGAVLVSLGMYMLAVAHPREEDAPADFLNIWVTQGFTTGLGMSCFFVASSQIAATWFPHRKGMAVGVVACGASIAGVVYPSMTRYLIESSGFFTACLLVATLVTVTSAFSFAFATPNPAHTHPKPQSYRALRTWIDTDAFKNKSFCWFTAGMAFLFLGFYPVFFNLEEWAAVSGFGTRNGSRAAVKMTTTSNKPLQTFWLLAILNGSSTVGRLTMALFSDKTGALNMHIVTLVVSSILLLVLWILANSTQAAICFCVFFGMFSGSVIGLPPASIGNILNCTYNTPETKHIGHAKLGQWTGMMYSVAAIPALAGPVIAGHLVTVYSNYITVQVWAGGNLMIAAFFFIVARYYLPCYDKERVGTKIARMLGKHSDAVSEKGKRPEAEMGSDTDGDFTNTRGLSRATTQVPSKVVSPEMSAENVVAVPRMVALGTERNV